MKPKQKPYSEAIRCAVCHTEILSPPIGAVAGICAGLACLQPAVVTGARLRDYALIVQMVSAGRMAFVEPEPSIGITWIKQVPPKPAPKGCPIVLDDGSPRYRDWDMTAIIGGSDGGE